MINSDEGEVNCAEHGKGVSAVVCGHLIRNHGTPLGFVENSDVSGDLQGWCFACEYMYQQESEMNETFQKFNDMTIVCEQCYANIKLHHVV